MLETHEGFYVSVVSSSQPAARRGLVSGPYATLEAALENVDRVRDLVITKVPEAHFYGWGTARVEFPSSRPLPVGSQNGWVTL